MIIPKIIYSICYVIAIIEDFQEVENISSGYLYIAMSKAAILSLRIAAMVIKLVINFI